MSPASQREQDHIISFPHLGADPLNATSYHFVPPSPNERISILSWTDTPLAPGPSPACKVAALTPGARSWVFPRRPLTEECFQPDQAADEVVEVDDELVVCEASNDDLVELAGQLETCCF